jgi:hypothetical protein
MRRTAQVCHSATRTTSLWSFFFTPPGLLSETKELIPVSLGLAQLAAG